MLEDLDLSWCRGITGAAVGMLADACPNLRRLRLFGCTQVPQDSNTSALLLMQYDLLLLGLDEQRQVA